MTMAAFSTIAVAARYYYNCTDALAIDHGMSSTNESQVVFVVPAAISSAEADSKLARVHTLIQIHPGPTCDAGMLHHRYLAAACRHELLQGSPTQRRHYRIRISGTHPGRLETRYSTRSVINVMDTGWSVGKLTGEYVASFNLEEGSYVVAIWQELDACPGLFQLATKNPLTPHLSSSDARGCRWDHTLIGTLSFELTADELSKWPRAAAGLPQQHEPRNGEWNLPTRCSLGGVWLGAVATRVIVGERTVGHSLSARANRSWRSNVAVQLPSVRATIEETEREHMEDTSTSQARIILFGDSNSRNLAAAFLKLRGCGATHIHHGRDLYLGRVNSSCGVVFVSWSKMLLWKASSLIGGGLLSVWHNFKAHAQRKGAEIFARGKFAGEDSFSHTHILYSAGSAFMSGLDAGAFRQLHRSVLNDLAAISQDIAAADRIDESGVQTWLVLTSDTYEDGVPDRFKSLLPVQNAHRLAGFNAILTDMFLQSAIVAGVIDRFAPTIDAEWIEGMCVDAVHFYGWFYDWEAHSILLRLARHHIDGGATRQNLPSIRAQERTPEWFARRWVDQTK